LRIRILLSAALLCAVALGAFVMSSAPGGAASGPNLTVRSDILGSQWLVRDENLSAAACSVEEGNITPGLRRLVRFTVTTPNIGDADIFVGDPNAHVAANDGLFELATCHGHYHFRHYALYQLIEPRSGKIWRAAKRGFCMLDTDPNPASLGYGSPGPGKYHNCGAVGIPGNQGVTAGWADTYRRIRHPRHGQPPLRGREGRALPAQGHERLLPPAARVQLRRQRRADDDQDSQPPGPRRLRPAQGRQHPGG
jgi:hypothetical protein